MNKQGTIGILLCVSRITVFTALFLVLTIANVTSETRVIDGDAVDWVSEAPPHNNLGQISKIPGGTTLSIGEYAWRDAPGDEQQNFAVPDSDADLVEFKVTADTSALYFLAQFADLTIESGGSMPVQIQIAIDMDQIPLSGQQFFAGLADTNVNPSAQWEYLVNTLFGSGGTAEVVDTSFTQVGLVPAVLNIDNDSVEIGVDWGTLGLSGPPQTPLRFTVAVFRQFLDDETADILGSSDVLDAITNYGDPGESGSTFTEVSDGVVDYYFDVFFSSTGEAYSPVLITELLYEPSITASEFIEIMNVSPVAIDLAGFKLGDEETPDGSEAMEEFPVEIMGSGSITVLAKSAEAFLAYYGFNPDFAIDPGATGVQTTSSYSPWASGSLILSSDGEEVLLLDPNDTVLDVIAYRTGSWPGVVPHPGGATSESLQRHPSNVDTDDCSTDFVASVITSPGNDTFEENHAAIANDQSITTNEDYPVNITLTADDPDGDPLTYFVLTPPSNGSLSGTPPELIYTPNTDFYGADFFTFIANDEFVDSNIATIWIDVISMNDDPEIIQGAGPLLKTTVIETPIDFELSVNDVDADPIAWAISSPATNGIASINGAGTTRIIVYTPNSGWIGDDSFIVQVNDGNGGSDNIEIIVTVVEAISETRVIDGDSVDWVSEAPPHNNLGQISKIPGGTTLSIGEYAWRDAPGDEQQNFAVPDSDADLVEFKVTADTSALYFLAQFADLTIESGGSMPVQIQIAIDMDQIPLSGQQFFAGLADTNVNPSAQWEYLVNTLFGSGGTAEVVDTSFTQVGLVPAVLNIDNDSVEIGVDWGTLGLSGPPQTPLRFTVAVFRQFLDDETADILGSSDVLDAITNYGDPGESGSTFTEVSDGVVDYYFDVFFSSTGEAYSPVLITELLYEPSITASEFIEIMNVSPVAIDLAGFKLGDEETPDGSEAMEEFPVEIMGSGSITVLAKSAEAFLAYYGFNPDFAIDPGATGVQTTSSYSPWASGSLILSSDGEEVLLLDPNDTVLDVIAYRTGSWPGVVPHPGGATSESLQRHPSNVDTDDCSTDFVASVITSPGNDTTIPDTDGDGVPDNQDICQGYDDTIDADGDGTPDGCDECPNDPFKVEPSICGCGIDDTDSDLDDIADCIDTCPYDLENDADSDGICGDTDTCPYDPLNDIDSDGVCGDVDGCPSDPNKTEAGICGCGVADTDTDQDGTADCNDICQGYDDNIDADGDSVPDGCDNCPNDFENDADSDGICGDTDTCPYDPLNDIDSDGVCGDVDGCPNNRDKKSPGVCGCLFPDLDGDGDGIFDCRDNCPSTPNPGQENEDGDRLGDECDAFLADQHEWIDPDDDGIGNNTADNCPEVASSDLTDTDGDGVGDVCSGYTSIFDIAFDDCGIRTPEQVNITKEKGSIDTHAATGTIDIEINETPETPRIEVEGTLTTEWQQIVYINYNPSSTYSGWYFGRALYTLSSLDGATYSGDFYVIGNNTTSQAWGRTTGDLIAATRKIGDARRWFVTNINGSQATGTINFTLTGTDNQYATSITYDTAALIIDSVRVSGTSEGYHDGTWENNAQGIKILDLNYENGFVLATYTTSAGSGKGWLYFHDSPKELRRFGSLDGAFFGASYRSWYKTPSCDLRQVTHYHQHVLNGGVAPSIEGDAPNGGDANGDGTDDSLQDNVVSVVNVGTINAATENYVTIDTSSSDSGSTITNVSTYTESSFPEESYYTFPFGVVKFDVIGLPVPVSPDPPTVETIRVYYYGVIHLTPWLEGWYLYMKYNPYLAEWTHLPPHCEVHPDNCVTFGVEEINGVLVAYADLTITDGGHFDFSSTERNDDPGSSTPYVPDGVISDPGGPALPDADGDDVPDAEDQCPELLAEPVDMQYAVEQLVSMDDNLPVSALLTDGGDVPVAGIPMSFIFTSSEDLQEQACETTTDMTGTAACSVVGLSPDVYQLTVQTGAGCPSATAEVLLVVYDPNVPRATGGGFILPDGESTLPAQDENDKANFGFIIKLDKNQAADGNLEFQYKAAGINLKSYAMEWYTISNNKAMFQGEGTVNGEGLYTFRVTATDGDLTGDQLDAFYIKIWDGLDTEADPYHKAKNDLAGGSIVIHKK